MIKGLTSAQFSVLKSAEQGLGRVNEWGILPRTIQVLREGEWIAAGPVIRDSAERSTKAIAIGNMVREARDLLAAGRWQEARLLLNEAQHLQGQLDRNGWWLTDKAREALKG